MKKFLIPILLAVALFASACNGHGSDSKQQVIKAPHNIGDVSIWGYHNHEKVSDSGNGSNDKVRAKVRWDGVSNSFFYRMCIQYVVSNIATGDAVDGTSGEKCTVGLTDTHTTWKYITSPTKYSLLLAVGLGSRHAEYEINAFESRVHVIYVQGDGYFCDYHDADEANPSWCPGRDANGN